MSWGSAQEAATLYSLMAAFPQSSVEEVGLCWLESSHLPPEWGFLPGSLPPMGASPDAVIRHSATPSDSSAAILPAVLEQPQQNTQRAAAMPQPPAAASAGQQVPSQLPQTEKDKSADAIEQLLQRLELSSPAESGSQQPKLSSGTAAAPLPAAARPQQAQAGTSHAQPALRVGPSSGPGTPPGLASTSMRRPAQISSTHAGVYTMQADGTLVSQAAPTSQVGQTAGARAEASGTAAAPSAEVQPGLTTSLASPRSLPQHMGVVLAMACF